MVTSPPMPGDYDAVLDEIDGRNHPTRGPLDVDHCNDCDLPIQWATTSNGRRIPLQPGQFPTRRVPRDFRWTFAGPVAVPGTDGTQKRCRLVHLNICPARPPANDPVMASLRQILAQRTTRPGP